MAYMLDKDELNNVVSEERLKEFQKQRKETAENLHKFLNKEVGVTIVYQSEQQLQKE